MASSSMSSWTPKQNKQFERALALFEEESPERWENVAKAVAGKSPEDVKRHYELLLEDLRHIESGLVPIPNYKSTPTTTTLTSDVEQRLLKYLKLQ